MTRRELLLALPALAVLPLRPFMDRPMPLKRSTKPDGPDDSLIRPSDWNQLVERVEALEWPPRVL